MIKTILPYKLEITNDEITPHGGLILLGEFMKGLDLSDLIDKELPKPGSGVGYSPSSFVEPLILMLNGGGRTLEDLREIRYDSGLRELLKLEHMPSSDATGDWLRRMGQREGLHGLERVNRVILHKRMDQEDTMEYTLDIDATSIESEKESAKMTYKGFKGYYPIVGHLAENGLVIGDEFREGNESPASRNLEFIKYCISQMPEGKRIKYLRSDSAAYQSEIINFCEDNDIKFAIGCDLDASVQQTIDEISENGWKNFKGARLQKLFIQ